MNICQSTRRVRGKLQVCIADHSQTPDHQWVIAQPDNQLVYLSVPPDPMKWIIVGIFIAVAILFGAYVLLVTGEM